MTGRLVDGLTDRRLIARELRNYWHARWKGTMGAKNDVWCETVVTAKHGGTVLVEEHRDPFADSNLIRIRVCIVRDGHTADIDLTLWEAERVARSLRELFP